MEIAEKQLKWTEAKFNSFIKSALRAASQRWPAKYDALSDAYVGKKVNSKTGRTGKHYTCNICKNDFPASEVVADHIDPVIDPTVGFVTWDEVIRRMFCPKEGYQILCSTCHAKKSTAERQQAKERRDNAKQQLQNPPSVQ